MSLTKPLLIIVAALPCEARYFLDACRLKKTDDTAYSLYVNTDETIALIVSGVGKLHAAMAVSYAFAVMGRKKHTCWLNLGIAGSNCYSVGDIVLANTITDYDKKCSWYPFISSSYQIPSDQVVTVDQVTEDYIAPMIDMESAGYYPAASFFVTHEQVQCCKVISDNIQHPHQSVPIKKSVVITLIQNQKVAIDRLVESLLSLSASQGQRELPIDDELEVMLNHWHFSHYQKNELKCLVERWLVILTDRSVSNEVLNEKNLSKAEHVLLWIKKQLDLAVFTFKE